MKQYKVLLTGGSKGIGKAIYEELSKNDMYIVDAPSHSELDINSNQSIDSYFESHGGYDVLINNAGINILGEINELDIDSINKMTQVNLIAPILLIQKVSENMKEKNGGRIINISSIWGIRSKEFRTLYSATKFGLNGITKSLSRELGPYNILINSVCPGYVNTEMTKKNVPEKIQDEIKRDIPLRRFAEPSEIAKVLLFLISEENTYITGQTIIADGGFLA